MNTISMNRIRFLLFSILGAVLLFSISCKDESHEQVTQVHDPNKPIKLTTFYPAQGGAKEKILLNGENFGSDPSAIEVYFNNKKADVVSSSGNRIYAIVLRLLGDNPVIKVTVGEKSAVYVRIFTYTAQDQDTTVTGKGETGFQEGSLNTAQVHGKSLELDAEGNLFMTWRHGGSFVVARINEERTIVN